MPGKPKGARPASKPAGAKAPGWARMRAIPEANLYTDNRRGPPDGPHWSKRGVVGQFKHEGRNMEGIGYYDAKNSMYVLTHARRIEESRYPKRGDYHKLPKPVVQSWMELWQPSSTYVRKGTVFLEKRGRGYMPPVTVIAP